MSNKLPTPRPTDAYCMGAWLHYITALCLQAPLCVLTSTVTSFDSQNAYQLLSIQSPILSRPVCHVLHGMTITNKSIHNATAQTQAALYRSLVCQR